jgi:predicted nucleic acid-binding protein
MIKKVFVDADIIMDLLAERALFYDSAANLFTMAYNNKVKLYTTAVVLANVFYLLRQVNGHEKAKQQLADLRLLVHVLPINENIVDMTLSSAFSDFEDGLQYFTTRENNIMVIISRNVKHYKVKDIIVQTAEDYIKISQLT